MYFPFLSLVINMTHRELVHFIVLFTCRECRKKDFNRYMNDRM